LYPKNRGGEEERKSYISSKQFYIVKNKLTLEDPFQTKELSTI